MRRTTTGAGAAFTGLPADVLVRVLLFLHTGARVTARGACRVLWGLKLHARRVAWRWPPVLVACDGMAGCGSYEACAVKTRYVRTAVNRVLAFGAFPVLGDGSVAFPEWASGAGVDSLEICVWRSRVPDLLRALPAFAAQYPDATVVTVDCGDPSGALAALLLWPRATVRASPAMHTTLRPLGLSRLLVRAPACGGGPWCAMGTGRACLCCGKADGGVLELARCRGVRRMRVPLCCTAVTELEAGAAQRSTVLHVEAVWCQCSGVAVALRDPLRALLRAPNVRVVWLDVPQLAGATLSAGVLALLAAPPHAGHVRGIVPCAKDPATGRAAMACAVVNPDLLVLCGAL